MPKDQQVHSVSRQRPVSCRFCRSRKLRCSREAPCSNCLSRGIRCDLERPAGLSADALSTLQPEIVERIRKLEELVANQKSQQSENVKQDSEFPDTYAQQAREPNSTTPFDHLDDDVAWLESICSLLDSSDKIPSNKVVFRIRPIQHIMEAQPYVNQRATLPSTRFEPSRCVWFPEYPEAKILVAKYVKEIDHIHHIVHTPSLANILEELYTSLGQRCQVKPGYVILLLSIFASCIHSWVQRDCEDVMFPAGSKPDVQSPMWIRAIEDVLDIAHRTTSVSIEGIQGIIITSFVLGNLEGFSRRFRSLYNMALFIARDLGLHSLDHLSNAHLANSAQTEMGRRVWWYLVASDWSIAGRLSDVAQGFYQCHVRQMVVKKPLNINDEAIFDGMSRLEQPLSQPTVMSYSLLRIRLSEISRGIVDRTPLIMAQAGGLSYDSVMDIDSELQSLINDIPPYFSMSIENLAETYQLDQSRAASLVHQGYMLHTNIYSHRCKIHLPYFNRGFADLIYAPSRDLCLRSARLIIQTEIQLENSSLCTARCYRFIGFLLGIFIATTVLFMDFCHKKFSPPLKVPQGEIAEAFRILEEARHESKTAAKFLDSLMHLLRRHKVPQPSYCGSQSLRPSISSKHPLTSSSESVGYGTATAQSHNDSVITSTPMTYSGVLVSNEDGVVDVGAGEDLSMYFNELAQSFEQGVDFGAFDWDSIFLELDSSFV